MESFETFVKKREGTIFSNKTASKKKKKNRVRRCNILEKITQLSNHIFMLDQQIVDL